MGQKFKVVGLLHSMDGSFSFVVDWWVVLGVVVCPFVTALIPVAAEPLLRFSKAEPP